MRCRNRHCHICNPSAVYKYYISQSNHNVDDLVLLGQNLYSVYPLQLESRGQKEPSTTCHWFKTNYLTKIWIFNHIAHFVTFLPHSEGSIDILGLRKSAKSGRTEIHESKVTYMILCTPTKTDCPCRYFLPASIYLIVCCACAVYMYACAHIDLNSDLILSVRWLQLFLFSSSFLLKAYSRNEYECRFCRNVPEIK